MNEPGRFRALCRRLIAAARRNGAPVLRWRATSTAHGQCRRRARTPVRGSGRSTRTRSALHQAIWDTLVELKLPPALVNRYADLAHDAIFYVDPHLCVRCRYRSTELLWQCPHCHEWNTFIEERIAPAKDTEATLTS